MSQLFSSYRLGCLELRNRIVIAPMCQYSAHDGNAGDWHQVHLGHMLLSGAGLLMLEATAVTPEGRITHQDLGLWSDANEAALQAVLMSVRRFSSMPITIQLSHAGRKASSQVPWEGGQLIHLQQGGWAPLAPSPVPHLDNEPAPSELDLTGLERLKQAFVMSAQRAQRIGIDAIELHAAHGYLLHQFLSPLSNHRTDAYGGSLENRMRFPLEVFEALRSAVPESMPVGVRISGTDWVEGAWDIEQSVVFSAALNDRGAAFVHVSSGGISPLQQIPLGPNYQVGLAERVRQATGLPTIAVGLVTEAQQAEDIVAQGRADLVALARAILFNPRWPWHAAAALGGQVEAPPPYWRSQPRGFSHLFGDIRIGQR